jgi:O-6-methylguanine DNA methyltransferase
MKFAVSACKVGYVAVAVSDKGICRVSFGTSPEELKKEFEAFHPDIEEVQTLEYLDKLLAWFQDPSVSLKDCEVDMKGTPFQLKVWEALKEIPSGQTWTYGRLAEAIGRPSAYRACSAACTHNTIAVFIPCHRVIRSDGAPTGYRWGPDIKTALLEHETKVNPEDAMVDSLPEENIAEAALSAEPAAPEAALSAATPEVALSAAIPEAALSAELLAEELSGSADVLSESAPETAEVQGIELSQEQQSEKATPDTSPETETSQDETETCTKETGSETATPETPVVEAETPVGEAETPVGEAETPVGEAETPVVETSTVEAVSSPNESALCEAEVTPLVEDIPTVTVTPPPAEDLVAAAGALV